MTCQGSNLQRTGAFELPRVLLIPDVIFGQDSGARSARRTLEVLKGFGCEVAVYADTTGRKSPKEECVAGKLFFARRAYSSTDHFIGNVLRREFDQVLRSFRPDLIFFAGAAVKMAFPLLDLCHRNSLPTMVLFYITDYYCSRVYAALPDGPCVKCLDGSYMHAWWNRCQLRIPRTVHFLKDVAVRQRLRGAFLRCCKALGYSDSQISIYRGYGFSSEQCIKSPVFFDRNCLDGVKSEIGDYFVLCGQARMEKGWHIMSRVLARCPGVRFKFVFPSKSAAISGVKRFSLKEFVNKGNLEIVTGLSDHSDLIGLLAKSRGVLVPSYYPTTGEFVLLEALGLGKPVMVFDVGYHAEMIRSGQNGMKSRIGDIESYASNINMLNESKTLYSTLSEGARETFEDLNCMERFESAFRQFPI